ncbi:MAG: hypothetical protein ACFFCM_05895 [Promethearchaeota archaeon]
MRKIELFKGILSGTVTFFSPIDSGFNFTIKINEEIEGLPEEFFVRFRVLVRDARRLSWYRITFLRKGDIVSIGGTLFKFFERKETLVTTRMKADYVYNKTLKHGVGSKIKRKEVFRGSLSGTATSDEIYSTSELGAVFSMKLDLEIEGLPNEFLVYNYKFQGRVIIRKGDKVLIEGKLFQGSMGKNGLEIIEMEAEHIYNSTLQCGF